MKITIKVTKNYGTEAIYPVCDQAKAFARIAGTKTLTRETLNTVRSMGYEIAVEQPVVTL